MRLFDSFENPPDHVFIILGTIEELSELEQEFSSRRTPSVITNIPLKVASNPDLWHQKFTFSSPRDAMLFKLSVE